LIVTCYSPNSDDSDNNNSFIDIDDFLSGVQQKNIPASADPNSSSITKIVDNRTRGSSPNDSCRFTAGSSCSKHIAFF
jgi:hypothetical protein